MIFFQKKIIPFTIFVLYWLEIFEYGQIQLTFCWENDGDYRDVDSVFFSRQQKWNKFGSVNWFFLSLKQENIVVKKGPIRPSIIFDQ